MSTKQPPAEKSHKAFRSHGFTLVELTIVLVIIALLAGGMLVSLSAQQESAARSTSERRITEVIEALSGYAAANGRLPCPAAPASTGVESPLGGGDCANDWDGFVPARTLSLGPTDANGYLLDAWNNPIRYAVTNANADSFTTAGGMRNNWSGGMTPDLRVCNTGVGIAGGNCASAAATLTDTAVAVVYSRGRNGGVAPASTDETANGNADRVVVSHTPTTGANEFDDIVAWLSPNVLYNRMIAAGRLP
jgi:prepilin-type N-terminal cleavage/methylation domain-containing protein